MMNLGWIHMQAVREVLEAWGMSLDLSSILGEGIISDGYDVLL